ncbi:hypothetical protein HRbin24_00533 [bacterium HR24]|nr:hypothetical protein HRbin24_00533 [bacterium HR24]
MTRKITVNDVRYLGGVTLPGQRARFAGAFRVPPGCLEVYGLVRPRAGTPYIHWRLGPATPQALALARELARAQAETGD